MSLKMLFFSLVFVCATSLMCGGNIEVYATAVKAPKEKNEMDMNANFVKLNHKVEVISETVDELLESSSNDAADVNEIKTSIKQLVRNSERNNERIIKIEKMLLELIEAKNDQKNRSTIIEEVGLPVTIRNDVTNKMKSTCNLICESKMNMWENESSEQLKLNLEKLDMCINNNNNNNYSIIKNDLKTSNACNPNPCFNGGQCEPAAYYCSKCPYPTSGRHCENLNCNKANRCFHYQHKMYVVLEESATWDKAYDKCIGANMSLAMPKDQETSEFLISQLRFVYGETTLYFWIGLKNDGTKEWRWLDGTLLGDYTGGVPDFKSQSGERWGIMWLDGKTKLWWPRSIGGVANGNHYSLCEKRLSIIRL